MDSTLCFSLIIIILSSLSLVFSQYVLPNHHFINCGSNIDIDFTGKRFIGDNNQTTFLLSGGRNAVNNNNNDNSRIYQTARVFTQKSWYEFVADDYNSFVMVHLHFSKFSYNGFELSNSKFDVSVLGFPLLSGFNVGDTKVKEFIIPIGNERTFKIEFTPSFGSSYAYVNAIEAFTTPNNMFRRGAVLQHLSPVGKIGDMNNISTSYAFNPVHRINVGGSSIDLESDTLRRNWRPDDPFIFNNGTARIRNRFVEQLYYREGSATRFDAPDDVYKTAKQLIKNMVNITWNFGVSSNSMFLVRAHFCDIISTGLRDKNDSFNYFVYSYYKEIYPGNIGLQVPFYVDFVVDSVESGFLNVSIGEIRGNNQTVFLNGLEIMELLSHSGVDGFRDGGKTIKKVYIVVGCVLGGMVLVLVLLVAFFMGSKYEKAKPVAGVKTESNAVTTHYRSSYTSINIDFTVNHPSPIPNLKLSLRFPISDILQATNNFDEKLMIGQGGFGKVYKGTLLDGTIVAVKRGKTGHGQGRPEFVTEIMVLSRIRHRHLVTLIGYCDEKSEMILVYEIMQKGTLQDHLYNSHEDHKKLSWNQRLEICISATRGFHYLHTGSDAGTIHGDVKSTNILLDENYVAKVADFGISRLDNVEENDITHIKGSFGYLDPEYIRCMKLTKKSDVYSFGVVLLEVLCARPALDNNLPQNQANLADWAIKQMQNGNVETIIDPFLEGKINPNSLRKFLDTVERCLKDTGDERPSILDVLWDLEYALKLQEMVVDKEPYEDSTVNTSFQLPMSMLHRLPSNINDDSQVNGSSASSFPNESQVFSQLKIDEAR